MTEINFENYLGEDERKEIVVEVFRQHCEDTIKGKAERIICNSAYHMVFEMVDKHFDGELTEILKDKVIKIIEELSSYCVFQSYEARVARKILDEAVKENKDVLVEKVKNIINELDDYHIGSLLEKALLQVLSDYKQREEI